MEICRVTFPPIFRSVLAGLLGTAILAGCSTFEDLFTSDKVDYRSGSTTRSTNLEIPPDLTQLSRESRYQLPSGSISASAFQTAVAPAATASATPAVAPQAIGAFRLERLGNERWLSTSQSPEDVYPKVRAFWRDGGFTLVEDRAEAGVLETDWAENRAKLPQDIIRKTVGKLLDNVYSTGELDKFRTRIERTPTGCDIYISHRGMMEVYADQRRETTVWQPRPTDPQLEAEFLSRLMVKLGAKEEQAKVQLASAAAAAPVAPAHARLLADRPGPTLQLDDNFDRAWRRVGIALDRSGFTVEDRDRTQGLYFVRYIDPKFAGREEPNFVTRMFSFGRKSDEGSPVKYRVKVTSEGVNSNVAVLDSQGKPENSDNGKRIAGLLLDDLK
jgi:outer membrane protein assembly factor BamC